MRGRGLFSSRVDVDHVQSSPSVLTSGADDAARQVERFLAEQEPLEEDSEGDLEDEAAAAPSRGGGGFGVCTLSPALQAFLGEESLSRSQVSAAG